MAQNKSADSETTDRAANENTGEDEKTEDKQKRVPGSSSEDKDNKTRATKAAQLIRTMPQAVGAHRKCSCERCNDCQLKSQSFKHRTANNIKGIAKEIQWQEEIQRLVLAFGHEQETIEVGRMKARGHLAKVKLGVCLVKFEHEIQQEDEITVLEDASGLIYGV